MKKLCILIAACAVLAACDKQEEQASKTAVPAATQQETRPASQPEAKPVEQAAPAEQAAAPAEPADNQQQ
ncbi:hypothetical protein M2D07_017905 [Pseudomonas sp. BGr12]|uniref:hypothetical protein n=1 Tax=unclassified Pseudomonas TaxID=196821 RepID=UPI00177C1AA0|nr:MULTISPECIES: hypothetical protein [unclassified Pseudomonas]MBD9502682.1 hypothetical protein [Pseudomonas sp. PDM17]MDL2428896.1 hypothetical protein [Pseudomonas sp. BJa5]